LAEVLPLLERAKHGIEFFGMGDTAIEHWRRVKASKGLARMAAFFEFMSDLVACSDYRLLSNVQLQGAVHDEVNIDLINKVVNRITDNLAEPLSMSDAAEQMGMAESRFSRFFRKATGNNYTDFVNRIRINRACQLLMESDKLVTDICYEVGFNNVANFNRRFLDAKGTTPSDFRRQSASRFGVLSAH
jgi:AraC-like DNA-binding protein